MIATANIANPVELAIETLKHISSWRADDRETWLQVGMALHHTDKSHEMQQVWDEWSKSSTQYQVGECGRQWKFFKSDVSKPVTVRSLVKWARSDTGWTPPGDDKKKKVKPGTPRPSSPPVSRFASNDAPLEAAIEAAATAVHRDKGTRWALVHTFIYPGDFHILRFEPETHDDKTFRPLHRNGQGWKMGDPVGPLPLYHADRLTDAKLIIFNEGEKCVEAAESIGLIATTTAHGAQSPQKSDLSPAAGKDVAILPDNDPNGRKYSDTLAGLLGKLNPPARVKIIELPGLPPKGDIVEFIEARECAESDAIKAEIMALIEAAPVWTPTIAATDAADGRTAAGGHGWVSERERRLDAGLSRLSARGNSGGGFRGFGVSGWSPVAVFTGRGGFSV